MTVTGKVVFKREVSASNYAEARRETVRLLAEELVRTNGMNLLVKAPSPKLEDNTEELLP